LTDSHRFINTSHTNITLSTHKCLFKEAVISSFEYCRILITLGIYHRPPVRPFSPFSATVSSTDKMYSFLHSFLNLFWCKHQHQGSTCVAEMCNPRLKNSSLERCRCPNTLPSCKFHPLDWKACIYQGQNIPRPASIRLRCSSCDTLHCKVSKKCEKRTSVRKSNKHSLKKM